MTTKAIPNSPSPTLPDHEEEEYPLQEGTVLRAAAGGYDVHIAGENVAQLPPLLDTHFQPVKEKTRRGVVLTCTLGGRLKKGPRKQTQPVAVGDRVRVRPTLNTGGNVHGERRREGFVEEVLPRSSVLGRSRYGKTSQIAVANLHQIVIVMAMRAPALSTHRLDRFLVLAEASDLNAIICLNKIDLLKKREIKSEVEPLVERYEKIGYSVLPVAADKDKGIKPLRKKLKDQISAFIGSSGVGKSSLAMAVQTDLMLWVGEVMEIGKGRHTTTEVSLHPIDGGGYIADTPGIKTVTLLEQQEVNLPNCFPEFRRLAPACRFNDCSHVHEPGCAVRAAVEEETVARERYDSYVKMLDDDLFKLRLTR